MMRTVCVFLIGASVCLPAYGKPGPKLEPGEITELQLPDVQIKSAVHVEAGKKKNSVAHVKVDGVIGKSIQFELLLPDAWNGRFVMGGGGGYAGTVQNGARYSVNRGYATVGTDTGHQGIGRTAGWALDDMEAQVNFGHVAVHRTAEVAKAIIRA